MATAELVSLLASAGSSERSIPLLYRGHFPTSGRGHRDNGATMQLFDLRSGRVATVYFTIIVVGLLLAPFGLSCRETSVGQRYDLSGNRLPCP
jgi:hypothetical protein